MKSTILKLWQLLCSLWYIEEQGSLLAGSPCTRTLCRTRAGLNLVEFVGLGKVLETLALSTLERPVHDGSGTRLWVCRVGVR